MTTEDAQNNKMWNGLSWINLQSYYIIITGRVCIKPVSRKCIDGEIINYDDVQYY